MLRIDTVNKVDTMDYEKERRGKEEFESFRARMEAQPHETWQAMKDEFVASKPMIWYMANLYHKPRQTAEKINVAYTMVKNTSPGKDKQHNVMWNLWFWFFERTDAIDPARGDSTNTHLMWLYLTNRHTEVISAALVGRTEANRESLTKPDVTESLGRLGHPVDVNIFADKEVDVYLHLVEKFRSSEFYQRSDEPDESGKRRKTKSSDDSSKTAKQFKAFFEHMFDGGDYYDSAIQLVAAHVFLVMMQNTTETTSIPISNMEDLIADAQTRFPELEKVSFKISDALSWQRSGSARMTPQGANNIGLILGEILPTKLRVKTFESVLYHMLHLQHAARGRIDALKALVPKSTQVVVQGALAAKLLLECDAFFEENKEVDGVVLPREQRADFVKRYGLATRTQTNDDAVFVGVAETLANLLDKYSDSKYKTFVSYTYFAPGKQTYGEGSAQISSGGTTKRGTELFKIAEFITIPSLHGYVEAKNMAQEIYIDNASAEMDVGARAAAAATVSARLAKRKKKMKTYDYKDESDLSDGLREDIQRMYADGLEEFDGDWEMAMKKLAEEFPFVHPNVFAQIVG